MNPKEEVNNTRKRNSAYGFCALLIVFGSTLLLRAAQAPAKQAGQAKPAQPKRVELASLFSKGLPYGLYEFDVPSPPGSLTLYTTRLAVLDDDGLRIFTVEDSMLTEEFALRGPYPTAWDRLDAFPGATFTGSSHPGVVLWKDEEVSYSGATVVCYVRGRPQVVFEGEWVDFVQLDNPEIPEIVTEEYDGYSEEPTKFGTVWAWNGNKYVKVKRIALADLHSKDVLAEVFAVEKAKN